MRVAISTGGKPTFRILGGDRLQGCSDGIEQRFLRSGLGGLQEIFDLRPHLLGGVEVRTIRGKEPHLGPGRFDQFNGFFVLVSREIIQDNNIAWTQAWQKRMPHIFAEDVGVGCPVDGHAGRAAIQPN